MSPAPATLDPQTNNPNHAKSRLGDDQLKLLLDKIGQQPANKPTTCRRAHPRLAYPRTGLDVRVIQLGGAAINCVMASRNLSARGICLLHNRFHHVGTACSFVLRRHLGGEEVVTGRVAWCNHVAGTMHMVGVAFGKQIFVKHFLAPEECRDLLEHAADADLAALSGRVLLVDDQEMDRMLFAHSLSATECEIVTVPEVGEAAEQMMLQPFDVVVCDLNLGGRKGEEAIANFRAAGFKGYVVALTAESDPARLKAAQVAGANDVLQKPYETDKLRRHLAAWLRAARGTGIYSTLRDQPGVEELLESYLRQVTEVAAQLKQAVREDDLPRARAACQSLKGTGSGYGYAVLSDAARDAVTSLDASLSLEESSVPLRLLEATCARLSAGQPPEADKALHIKKIDEKYV